MSKVFAVVGAGPLLGLSLARRFGRAGFKVALIARTRSSVEEFARQLQGEGIDAEGFVADANNEADLVSVFSAIESRLGPVDVLSYNPSVRMPREEDVTVGTLKTRTAAEQFQSYVLGAIAAVNQVLPGMRERDSGTIFITTGYAAHQPIPRIAGIAISQSSARYYARCLAVELEGTGVLAATVSIGGVITHDDPAFAPDNLAEVYFRIYETRQDIDTAIYEGMNIDGFLDTQLT